MDEIIFFFQSLTTTSFLHKHIDMLPGGPDMSVSQIYLT